jgi:hypothetical protein
MMHGCGARAKHAAVLSDDLSLCFPAFQTSLPLCSSFPRALRLTLRLSDFEVNVALQVLFAIYHSCEKSTVLVQAFSWVSLSVALNDHF